MDVFETFVFVVQKAEQLPESFRANVSEAKYVEHSSFDESYIEFLEGQIQLGVRGVDWTKRLMKRKAALIAFCNHSLIYGRIQVGDKLYSAHVDPKTETVVHWEEY